MGQPSKTAFVKIFVWAACALTLAGTAAAQSTDVGQPTPVFNGEVTGAIAPRDLGDARLTRHFYAFGATEGDLVLTVESTDLSGDIDLFTASTLRPLLKITLYAVGSTPTRVTKSVYLRREESLILRVEGRTVIDTDARYRIRIGGPFKPASGAQAQVADAQPTAEPETPASNTKGRRTTSTGARIPGPVIETATQPEPAAADERPAEPAKTEAAREPARRGAGRRASSRSSSRNSSRRARPSAAETTTPGAEKSPAEADAEATKAAEEKTSETTAAAETSTPSRTRPRTPRRGATRRGARTDEARPSEGPADAAGDSAAAAAEPSAEPGTRLVIVTKDGELFARDMKSVRRVTVERGQIVVVGTDGRVTRHPMSNVVRMAIEP